MNHKSSRSHSIFRLRVRSHTTSDSGEMITDSLLNFVDLAGSEKLDVHESPRGTPSKTIALQQGKAKNNRIKETKYINKSLFFLTQVISQLGRGKHESHVPYRNSMLTKLLKNSLGGNAKTLLVLCISPGLNSITNSVSTLRFGLNARRISNHIKTNILEINSSEDLKRMIRLLESKISQLEVDRIKEKNQGEELIDMVRKLMNHKKDLLDRMSRMELEAGGKLADKDRAVVQEAVNLHEEIDMLLMKHHPSREEGKRADNFAQVKYEPEDQSEFDMKMEEDCIQLKKQNFSLIHSVNKLRQRLIKKAQGKKKVDRMLAGLLEDTSILTSMSDQALRNIKRKLQSSIEDIDEHLITRKIAKRLTVSLGQSQVFIDVSPEESQEDVAGLTKRPPIKGRILGSSVEYIMQRAHIEATPILPDDDLLPQSLRPKFIPVESTIYESPKMKDEEIDLLEEGSIGFEVGNLSQSQKKQDNNMVSNFNYENELLQENRVSQRVSNLCNTSACCLIVPTNVAEGVVPNISNFEAISVPENQPVKSRSAATNSSSNTIFKLVKEREPLKDKQNALANNSTESNKIKFATPGSKGTTMYYFTTRKNEFDFSFDKNVIAVERQIGSALLSRNIRKNSTSDAKENLSSYKG